MRAGQSEFSWFIGEGIGKSDRGERRLAFMFCVHRTGPRVARVGRGPTLLSPKDLPFGLGRLVPPWLPIVSPLKIDMDDRPLLMAAVYDLDEPAVPIMLLELEVEHEDFDPTTFSAVTSGGELSIHAFDGADPLPGAPETILRFVSGNCFGARLQANSPGFDVDLFVREAKRPVVYGVDGSPRIEHGDVVTSYFQRSRLEVMGAIGLKGKHHEVIERFVGGASHDRQWLEVTSPQLKWMWPHLRFSDGTELMGYVLRDSSAGRWASPDDGREIGRAGWLVDIDGTTRALPSFDVSSVPEYEVEKDRGLVPTRFAVTVPELDLRLTLEHVIKAPYVPMKAFGAALDAGAWEGPARIVSANRPIEGHAWVEVVNAATARLGRGH